MMNLTLAQTIFYIKNNGTKYFMKIFIAVLSIIIISMLVFTISDTTFINIYIIILSLILSLLQIFTCEQGLLAVESEVSSEAKGKIFFKVLMFNILSVIIMILLTFLIFEIFEGVFYNNSMLSHLFYSEFSLFFFIKKYFKFFQ